MRVIFFLIFLLRFAYTQNTLLKECQKYISIENIEYHNYPQNGYEDIPDSVVKIMRKLPRGLGLYKHFMDSIFWDTTMWKISAYNDSIAIYPNESFKHPYDFYINNVYIKSLRGYRQLDSDWVTVDSTVFLTPREKLFLYEDRYMYFQPKYQGEKFKLTILNMNTCECIEAVLETNHHKINLSYYDKWVIRYEDYYQSLKK